MLIFLIILIINSFFNHYIYGSDLACKHDKAKIEKELTNSLIYSATKGNYKNIERLLKTGANTESIDNSGRTALYWASIFGHKDIVSLLLKNKANINHQDFSGWTPLHGLAAEGDSQMFHFKLRNHNLRLW